MINAFQSKATNTYTPNIHLHQSCVTLRAQTNISKRWNDMHRPSSVHNADTHLSLKHTPRVQWKLQKAFVWIALQLNQLLKLFGTKTFHHCGHPRRTNSRSQLTHPQATERKASGSNTKTSSTTEDPTEVRRHIPLVTASWAPLALW